MMKIIADSAVWANSVDSFLGQRAFFTHYVFSLCRLWHKKNIVISSYALTHSDLFSSPCICVHLTDDETQVSAYWDCCLTVHDFVQLSTKCEIIKQEGPINVQDVITNRCWGWISCLALVVPKTHQLKDTYAYTIPFLSVGLLPRLLPRYCGHQTVWQRQPGTYPDQMIIERCGLTLTFKREKILKPSQAKPTTEQDS